MTEDIKIISELSIFDDYIDAKIKVRDAWNKWKESHARRETDGNGELAYTEDGKNNLKVVGDL